MCCFLKAQLNGTAKKKLNKQMKNIQKTITPK